MEFDLNEYLKSLPRKTKEMDIPGTVEAYLDEICPLCGKPLKQMKPCCGSPNGYKMCVCGYKIII